MKRLLACAALAVAGLSGAHAGPSVGISLDIWQPGVYGRIDIGRPPAPALVFPQPIVVVPAPVAQPPIYLYVPPDHRAHWARYCRSYGACGHPVYFVHERWIKEYHYRVRHTYDDDDDDDDD